MKKTGFDHHPGAGEEIRRLPAGAGTGGVNGCKVWP